MDKEYMRLAIAEAEKCIKHNDVPCGAVIIKDGKVISRARNVREKKSSTISHAEIMAIVKANKRLRSNRLDGAIIYITKEPCLMCMGAILSARIDKIVFGAYDLRYGTQDLATNNNFNHKCEIVGGVLEEECKEMLTGFFSKLRVRNASTRETKHSNKFKE